MQFDYVNTYQALQELIHNFTLDHHRHLTKWLLKLIISMYSVKNRSKWCGSYPSKIAPTSLRALSQGRNLILLGHCTKWSRWFNNKPSPSSLPRWRCYFKGHGTSFDSFPLSCLQMLWVSHYLHADGQHPPPPRAAAPLWCCGRVVIDCTPSCSGTDGWAGVTSSSRVVVYAIVCLTFHISAVTSVTSEIYQNVSDDLLLIPVSCCTREVSQYWIMCLSGCRFIMTSIHLLSVMIHNQCDIGRAKLTAVHCSFA